MAARILVIDDEPDLLDLVRLALAEGGFEVETCLRGREGLERARKGRPDLLVLDLMLPDVPGTEVLRQIRRDPVLADLPVVMLTARGEEVDRIVGFELGADDYVTKPFSPRELLLRVRAILRRRGSAQGDGGRLEHGAIRLDPERHRCEVEGRPVDLTPKEFDLLRTLMERPGRVLSRARLLEVVWGTGVRVTDRTVDTHVKRLREKLGPEGARIETVRGVGYRFAE